METTTVSMWPETKGILRGPFSIRTALDQPVPLRDGVKLSTDLYLPEVDERVPAIILRHPYNTRVPWVIQLARLFAGFGYAAVFQNVRGRFKSEGEFGSLKQEAADGYDAAVWLSGQPWFDGRLFTIGMSYSVYAAHLMINSGPPGITPVGLINFIPGGRVGTYRNGALALHWALPWSVMMGPEGIGALREVFRDADLRYSILPLAEAPPPECRELFEQTIGHLPLDDDHWRPRHVPPGMGPCPTLDITGWYDFWVDAVTSDCRGLTKASMKHHHTLVIGPWNHETVIHAILPDLLADGSPKRVPVERLPMRFVIDWMARCVGGPTEFDDLPWPDMKLYSSSGQWLSTGSWPPAGLETVVYYLSGDSRANSVSGGGRLVAARPPETADTFEYDPDHPVPTIGGNLWAFPPVLKPGPADQAPLDDRQDVLVYQSAPLDHPLNTIGEATVELWVASSARDTDFTAKLVDVHPDGRAMIVADSIVRCRYREPGRDDAFIAPYEPFRLRFPVGALTHRFETGHRVRLDVSSSNFPKWDRHLNTDEPLFRSTCRVKAEQRVFLGGERASRLELPVAP